MVTVNIHVLPKVAIKLINCKPTATHNGGWVPGISRGLHCGQPAPRWTTPLLANPRTPAMSPTRPGTRHTDLVSGEKKQKEVNKTKREGGPG